MVFAVIGGIIGMVIAMPLSDIMIDRFMIHIIIPKLSQRITIAIIMLILMILIMGIFILHSLRCMNKISVMDTIHGENKGERFKRRAYRNTSTRKKRINEMVDTRFLLEKNIRIR